MLGYKNNSVFLLFLFNPCMQGDSGWKFYLHHPLEVPTLGVQTHGTSLYPGQGRDLRLDLKKVSEKAGFSSGLFRPSPKGDQSQLFPWGIKQRRIGTLFSGDAEHLRPKLEALPSYQNGIVAQLCATF